MVKYVHRAWAPAIGLFLVACASTPIDTEGVDPELTASVAQNEPQAVLDQSVVWGGVIVATHNLADRTRIEMVSYPLDSRTRRPLTDQQPGARFLIYADGYLEPAEFEAGRRLTVRGTMTGTEEGRIGEADYTYPAVTSEALHLWPRATERTGSESRFRFGIGIILTN